MEVLWTAACTEMRIAGHSYRNAADMNDWLQPQATTRRRDGIQNAEWCDAQAVAYHTASSCAENVAEICLRRSKLWSLWFLTSASEGTGSPGD